MIVFRAFSWLLLLAAAIFLTTDLTRVWTGSDTGMVSTLTHWKETSPATLSATAAFVQSKLHPIVWTGVIARLLALPTWSLLGATGIIFALIARRKHRINIFAN
jgi:hypothetical protein